MARITILGDLMLGRYMVPIIKEKGLKNILFPLAKILKDSDCIIANLECVLCDKSKPRIDVKNSLYAPTTMADELKSINIKAVSLANNHIEDCGGIGIDETLTALSKRDINFFGTSGWYIINIDGVKVGFVSFVYPYMYNLKEVKYIVSDVKKYCDILIAMVHTGIELYEYPLPRDVNVCKKIIDYGADLVVGSHSHCIQASEVYKGKHIFYGIGDLVSDSNDDRVWKTFWKKDAHPRKFNLYFDRKYINRSLILELDINNKKTFDINVVEYNRGIKSFYDNPTTLWRINDKYCIENNRKRIQRDLLKSLRGR